MLLMLKLTSETMSVELRLVTEIVLAERMLHTICEFSPELPIHDKLLLVLKYFVESMLYPHEPPVGNVSTNCPLLAGIVCFGITLTNSLEKVLTVVGSKAKEQFMESGIKVNVGFGGLR